MSTAEQTVSADGAGGVVVAPNGTLEAAKKQRRKASRNKPKKPKYATPVDEQGKAVAYPVGTSITPGFNVESHAMLKETDFTDSLDYAKWRVWYFGEKQQIAEREVQNLLALGKTPEERKAAKDDAKLLKVVERELAKAASIGTGTKKSAMDERLQALFAKYMAGQSG